MKSVLEMGKGVGKIIRYGKNTNILEEILTSSKSHCDSKLVRIIKTLIDLNG